jgi:hypothetical protein
MIAESFVLLCFASIACEALVIRSPASIAGTYLHETGTSRELFAETICSLSLSLSMISIRLLFAAFPPA